MTVKTVKSDNYWLGWREGKKDAQRDFSAQNAKIREIFEQIMRESNDDWARARANNGLQLLVVKEEKIK